ncbi:MAG: VWA domain-containing protein [Vicinamibacterales bacterium]
MKRLFLVGFVLAGYGLSTAQPSFRALVEVVEVDVSVTRKGQPVPGLTSSDFIVTDNGVPQAVESITLDQLPLNVTLVLDVSQSLAGARLVRLTQAGHELTRALRAEDQAAVVTFADEIVLRLPTTGDMARVRAELGRLGAAGPTALRDAVHLAVQLRPPGRTRSLLLLFTDGRDTASWLTEGDVLESVRRAGTVIHIVRTEADTFLNRLAEASGGRVWSATSDDDLNELFTRALDEMRARYLLTYSPEGVNEPGWHQIRVSLKGESGEIRARPGYLVAEPRSP